MLVVNGNWTIDTVVHEITDTDTGVKAPLPDKSTGALVYFGSNYLRSQASARTVIDSFKRDWLEDEKKREGGNKDAKMSDVPKSAVPASDSPEYRARLAAAIAANLDKLVKGYDVGVREGSGDPLQDEREAIARPWLQGVAVQLGWYELPAKRKVARDEDPYKGGKYETFGDALAAFMESNAPAAKLTGKAVNGQPWPFKTHAGESVADALTREAQRRLDERGEAKPSVTLAVEGDDAGF